MYHAAGIDGLTVTDVRAAPYPMSAVEPDIVLAAPDAPTAAADATPAAPIGVVLTVEFTGRRRNAHKRPSAAVWIETSSQPSADLRVSSAASASGLALKGLNAAYSNMVRRLTPARSLGGVTKTSRVGFFGPAGTFTEQALLTQPDLASFERIPLRTVPDVLDAVASGQVDVGFVPIENSIEGTVNFTQDALVFDHDLLIQREVVLDIEHCLLAPPATTFGDVKVVYSIPVATAQCHGYLRRELPSVEIRAAHSTAEAARVVADDTTRSSAAIAPENAAELYGLQVIGRNIADHEGNQTRFVLVGRDRIPSRTGNDKTSVVVFQRADEPGSLIGILQEFAARRINLSQLLSRPTKRGGLGDYCFIIYADGHISDEIMADALRDLRTKQGDVKFLGSYPTADGQTASTRDHADQRWRDADDWITAIRARVDR